MKSVPTGTTDVPRLLARGGILRRQSLNAALPIDYASPEQEAGRNDVCTHIASMTGREGRTITVGNSFVMPNFNNTLSGYCCYFSNYNIIS